MTSPHSSINNSSLWLASREQVIQTLSGFAGKSIDDWLSTGHQAATGQFLDNNGKPYRRFTDLISEFTPQQIKEVLAATGPNHCLDGWTFFSRSLSALLSGDTHTARHLSYYAQLRAALSILNLNGVGIFNGINFAVDSTGNLHHIGSGNPDDRWPGTHQAAWDALRGWADNIGTAREFLTAIKFRNVSLQDCLEDVWPSATGGPLVSRIIEDWGVDLRRSAEEHESRNISSYCAHAFNEAESQLSTRLSLVESIWRSLEPDGGGGFPSLDRHLLRKFLELMKAELSEAVPPNIFWDSAYRRLNPRIKGFVSQKFVERNEDSSDLLVFIHADGGQPGDVHAMVSRALLLLRSATALVRSAFLDAQFDMSADNIQLWFKTVGIDRGFWSAHQPPEEYGELWDEVSYAVSALEQYVSNVVGDQLNFADEIRDQFAFLSQVERACIWGIGK